MLAQFPLPTITSHSLDLKRLEESLPHQPCSLLPFPFFLFNSRKWGGGGPCWLGRGSIQALGGAVGGCPTSLWQAQPLTTAAAAYQRERASE